MKSELSAIRTIQWYLDQSLGQIEAGKWCTFAGPIKSHAMWQAGHIASSICGAIELLGGTAPMPQAWFAPFKFGSTPVEDASKYPSVDEIKSVLAKSYETLYNTIETVKPDKLAAPNPNENMRPILPTTGEFAAFLANGHAAVHVGQLAVWRRAIGCGHVIG